MAYLKPALSAQILAALPNKVQKQVSMKIAEMNTTNPEILSEIEDVVEKKFSTFVVHDFSKAGGVEYLASIMNHCDRFTEKNIMEFLEAKDSILAQSVRDLMFVFEDIIILDDRAIQRVLREVDSRELALSMKGTKEEIREKIFRNMSERAQAMLQEDIEYLGPVRAREVQDAQSKIVATIRALEMAWSNKFSHDRPNGSSCFSVLNDLGINYYSVGENIAWGYSTPRDVMKGWMTSPGHKTNILNGGYRTIGIGCLVTKKGTYWVQCFGYDDLTAVTQPANATIAYRVAKDTSTTTSLIDGSQVEATTEQEETNEETTENSVTVANVSGLKVTAGKKKLTLNWKRGIGIDGYQIQISPNKNFKGKKTYKLETNTTSKVITKYKGKRLKSGKKYYVRVRTYLKLDKTVYSNWKTVSKKVK